MIATALGSFSGTDMAATIRTVLDLLPDRAPLPELPDRGPHAQMIPRTMCLLDDLPFDLQPSGWRLCLGPSLVARRARRMLADDIDVLAENLPNWTGTLTVTVAGPWTLGACIDLPRGGRSIADEGARRDIAQAWTSAIAEHASHLQAIASGPVAVQIDEPYLSAVLNGSIPDESGRHTLPRVEGHEVMAVLRAAVDAARAGGGDIAVVHSCANDIPLDQLLGCGADALSIPTQDLLQEQWELLAEWFRGGGQLWAGLLPTAQLAAGKAFLARRLDGICEHLGAPPETADRLVLTPACGMATIDRSVARRALEDLVGIAAG